MLDALPAEVRFVNAVLQGRFAAGENLRVGLKAFLDAA